MEMGYWFVWPPKKNPYLIDKEGNRSDFMVYDFIPYLIETTRKGKWANVACDGTSVPAFEEKDLKNFLSSSSPSEQPPISTPAQALSQTSSSGASKKEVDSKEPPLPPPARRAGSRRSSHSQQAPHPPTSHQHRKAPRSCSCPPRPRRCTAAAHMRCPPFGRSSSRSSSCVSWPR